MGKIAINWRLKLSTLGVVVGWLCFVGDALLSGSAFSVTAFLLAAAARVLPRALLPGVQ